MECGYTRESQGYTKKKKLYFKPHPIPVPARRKISLKQRDLQRCLCLIGSRRICPFDSSCLRTGPTRYGLRPRKEGRKEVPVYEHLQGSINTQATGSVSVNKDKYHQRMVFGFGLVYWMFTLTRFLRLRVLRVTATGRLQVQKWTWSIPLPLLGPDTKC